MTVLSCQVMKTQFKLLFPQISAMTQPKLRGQVRYSLISSSTDAPEFTTNTSLPASCPRQSPTQTFNFRLRGLCRTRVDRRYCCCRSPVLTARCDVDIQTKASYVTVLVYRLPPTSDFSVKFKHNAYIGK